MIFIYFCKRLTRIAPAQVPEVLGKDTFLFGSMAIAWKMFRRVEIPMWYAEWN